MERAADIRKMKTHNSISKDEIIQSHNELYDKLSALQSDNERLTQWVNDLQTGMYVNCVYCGHRYGPRGKTPVSMADVLKQHIETCPKHPMSLIKARLSEYEKFVDLLLSELARAVPDEHGHCRFTVEWLDAAKTECARLKGDPHV